MNKYIANALGSVSIGAVCVFGWAGWEVGSIARENRAEVKTGIHSVFAETRDITIAMIDKGRPGKPETMGLLPATRIVMQDVGSTLQTAQAQVAQTSSLVAATTRNLDAVGASVQKTADAATQTAQALTGSSNELTATLQTTNDTIAASRKPIAGLSDVEVNLNALLKREAIGTLIDQTAGFMGHANKIAGNADRVTTKLTDDYMTPKPWYKKIAPTVEDIWHIAGNVPY